MQSQIDSETIDTISGKRVLIVEDEIFVALDLKIELENAGVEVLGPVETLEDAIDIVSQEHIDVAVIDVDLRGKHSFPAADILIEKGTPFVWHTGGAERDVFVKTYPNVPVLEKPTRPDQIIAVLAELAVVKTKTD